MPLSTPSTLAPLGDWVCYNSHNELQPHTPSHRIPITSHHTRRSRLKCLLTTLFRKRNYNPASPNTKLIFTNDDDDDKNDKTNWTCHSRSFMRYETPQEVALGTEVVTASHGNGNEDRAERGVGGRGSGSGVCVSTASTLVVGEWGLQRVEAVGEVGSLSPVAAGGKMGVRLVTPTTPMMDGEGCGGVSPRSMVQSARKARGWGK